MTQFTRKLGGVTVSAVGMGCWAIGGPLWSGEQPLGWGEVDDEESIRAVRRAVELGVTFFDTANVYGAGHSEKVLAKALAGHRDEVVIATKFGNTFDEETRQTAEPNSTPGHVREAAEASLRRLGTDRIDLLQLHLNDLATERALALIPELDKLVSDGLVRAYGWSTDFPDKARAFAVAAGAHCVAIQHDLSVLQGSVDVLPVCEEYGLASINRGPLAMGLLGGKYTAGSKLADNDVRGKSPEWMRYYADGRPAPEYLARIEAVREVLTSDGRTLAQGALAWLWARSDMTIPIPGFRTVAQVEENAGALAYGPLTPAQLAEVESLLGR